MGMFRDAGVDEIDIVKEMAEGLGSTGLRLEDILEKADQARQKIRELIAAQGADNGGGDAQEREAINDSIRKYNALVVQAEDTRRWLLIQREACGFRTHRNVDFFYPIPPKMKLLIP